MTAFNLRQLPAPRPLRLDEVSLRAFIVECARSYEHVRYRHQGRTREHGLDCLGLLIAAARDTGAQFTLYDEDDAYSINPDGYYLVERLSECMTPLADWRTAGAGDVVVCRWHITRPPQHLGIVTELEPGAAVADTIVRCVHSSRRNKKVVENRWADPTLITHAFQIKELTEVITRGQS